MKKGKDIFLKLLSPITRSHIQGIHAWIFGEPEIKCLKKLCDRNKVSIDIGANVGDYTYFIKKYSKKCFAFEPNPKLYQELLDKFSESNVNVYNYAISSSSGVQELRIPLVNNQELKPLATLERNNNLDNYPYCGIYVNTVKLDDLGINSIGFIKIDVEGHEFEVLKGAEIILKREHPKLLVEIENRHNKNSFQNIFSYLSTFGYNGFFLLNKKLMPLKDFNIEFHQNIRTINGKGSKTMGKNIYINNFIFI